mgnify:FL=1
MSNKFAFSYCLLQYKHNPWLKERMNVGVLLYSQKACFLRLSVRGWDGRITAAYPDINKSAFTEDLKQISRAFDSFYRKNIVSRDLISSPDFSNFSQVGQNHAQFLAEKIYPGFDTSYTWAEGGVGLCKSAEERLQSLFDRFVAPYDKERPPAARSDEQVWHEINRLIVQRNLLTKIQMEPKVQTDLGPIKFQAGYQNGAFHALQSLSFDLADEDRISAKAGKWSGFAHAVRASKVKGEVVTQFILGRPSRQKLIKPYNAAKLFLRNVVGEENVIEESNGRILVDKIEDDLGRHHAH